VKATARLTDVARRARTSTTAVSMVLNGVDAGNVAPSTRERILTAARDLDYRPNTVARSLRRQRTQAVGLVTDSIASSAFAGRIVAGAVDAAAEADYAVLIVDSQARADRERHAFDELAHLRVEGVVYASMGLRRLDARPPTGLPLTLADCWVDGADIPSFIPDEAMAGRQAARHLVEIGHRRIVMLTGPGPHPRRTGNIAGPMRSRAFRAEMTHLGVSARESPVVRAGWSIDDGYRAALRVLADGTGVAAPVAERPSAIWAVTDRVATGVLLAATRLGLRVPEDLSVMGMDDQEELAANVVPPLTTMGLPHREIGTLAMRSLLRMLAGEPVEGKASRLSTPLVIRASTAPPTRAP
jgi:LacI family transcriptional regulator